MTLNDYKNRKILVTGHTGFKGTWMCEVLNELGAKVVGYSLEPPTKPSLYELLNISDKVTSYLDDIRDLNYLKSVFDREGPEIVIHMAAQPIVRESYVNPVDTYDINVMGTVNVLECCRLTDSVRSIVNVTTDKVYRNNEWDRGYIESDELCGYDPYSNSKSCSELVTDSYRNSFLREKDIAISTVRAGNVIGGGDFAKDRIIPDCVRAIENGEDIIVRNPYSTRPYQHVLEPVVLYLKLAMMQLEDISLAGCYNVGPDDSNCVSTGELVNIFCDEWKKKSGKNLTWINKYDGGPHEANFLKLDSSKIKNVLGWRPRWGIEDTMNKVVDWTHIYLNGGDIESCMRNQIVEYMIP